MIILDTNVVSEAMQPVPSSNVMRWLSVVRSGEEMFTTTVTVAEVLYGIELLPRGKRRDKLQAEAEAVFAVDLAGHILGFDEPAARAFAEIAAARRSQGRPIADFDAQIAAIAYAHRGVLATRNIADFDGCGIRLVNPWRDQSH
jgi:toxin FitB